MRGKFYPKYAGEVAQLLKRWAAYNPGIGQEKRGSN
ncbi:MAG: hypothetical protein RLZ10_735 [Bacteroidota bacterium]|jgi:hypothetical protein